MLLKLKKEFYEQNKELYLPQYLVWDIDKKAFIDTNKEDFEIMIKPLGKLSSSTKDLLKYIIKNWKNEIAQIATDDEIDKNLYNEIVFNLNNCLSMTKDFMDLEAKTTYFCCGLKNKGTYLSIGTFYIDAKEKTNIATLEETLGYPKSQINRDKKPNGTFSACEHNCRVAIISYIFKNKRVSEIHAEPINTNVKNALKELGFKKS